MSSNIHLFHNWINEWNRAVLVISGFAAEALWESAKRIFTILGEQQIPAFAMEKPGHFSRRENSSFSVSWLSDEIGETIQSLANDGFEQIALIGSSLSSISVAEAANTSGWLVVGTTYISPAFDIKKAIANKFLCMTGNNFPEFTNEAWVTDFHIPLQVIPLLAGNVQVDMEVFQSDLIKYGALSLWDIKKLIGEVPTTVFRNADDKIISPGLIAKLWFDTVDAPTIEGDKLHHTIEIAHIRDALLERVRRVFPWFTRPEIALVA